MLEVMDGLRRRGVRFSVDDAGGGFSGLSDILRIKPDLIKLDLHWSSGHRPRPGPTVDGRARWSHFADEIGARLVAVGIETPKELATLRDWGSSSARAMRWDGPSCSPSPT